MGPKLLETGYETMRKPIACPYCKSREIAFVTEYHKATGWRILATIVKYAIIIILITSIPDLLSDLIAYMNSPYNRTPDYKFNSSGLIFFIVTYLMAKIAINLTESRTHVECICKDCGQVWLHH